MSATHPLGHYHYGVLGRRLRLLEDVSVEDYYTSNRPKVLNELGVIDVVLYIFYKVVHVFVETCVNLLDCLIGRPVVELLLDLSYYGIT